MKRWNDLTTEEQAKALRRSEVCTLQTLMEVGPDFLWPDNHELAAEFEASVNAAERMGTPWFLHEYITDSAKLTAAIKADALRQAEGACYLEFGEYTL